MTNDDGVASEGLRLLASAIAKEGHHVVIAAPDSDLSGAGTSLVGLQRGRFHASRFDPPEGVEAAFAIKAGGPAVAVLAAMGGAFGDRPNFVVSGPNCGANTGMVVIHSGTVGGAISARTWGCSALAVSVDLRGDSGPHWQTALDYAHTVMQGMITGGQLELLSLNVPDLPADAVRGLRWAALDRGGSIRVAAGDEGSQMELRPAAVEPREGTDTALLAQNYATLTRLPGPWDDTAEHAVPTWLAREDVRA
jgi:5'-nucleotidase